MKDITKRNEKRKNEIKEKWTWTKRKKGILIKIEKESN